MLRITSIIALVLFLTAPAEAKHRHHAHHHRHHATASVIPVRVVAHPAGCPARAFCGCGAAVRVFGRPVRDLWLAANWYRFPRAAPAPGMAAVRPHHVFVLEADLGGGLWQVFDANSGGHLTRVHARAIAGYAIVNPQGVPVQATVPRTRPAHRLARASGGRTHARGGYLVAGP